MAATLAAVVALAAAGPARAALPGPSSLGLGFVDYPMFQWSSPSVQALWLSRADDIGSRWVRLAANWRDIAPYTLPRRFDGANPGARGYNWTSLDEDVEAAEAHHQNVYLMALEAPSWATGRNVPAGVGLGAWFPNAASFGAFGHALAERYSGRFPDPLHRHHNLPRVRILQAWNEPNLPAYIMPQWGRSGKGPWQPVGAEIYRSLLNAFYAGVKSAQPDDVVMAAGTSPYGDPPGTAGGRMRPVTFYKAFFCLTPGLRPARCSNPPHFDLLDHHPYAAGPTIPAHNPGDISVPDLGKIWTILHVAQHFGRALPAGPKSLWVTEVDWASTPPSSPELQEEYVPLALYVMWREGVTHVLWYVLADSPADINFRYAGVFDGNGNAKPAAAAFWFPFTAVQLAHTRHHARALWGKAPVPGTVSIQRLSGTQWRTIARLRTTRGGIFYTVRHLRAGISLRAVIGRDVSPVCVTGFLTG